MKDNNIKKQQAEWRKKSWSIPDLRGGKQHWFSILTGVIEHIGKNQPCSVNDIPVIPEIGSPQPIKDYVPFIRGVGLLQKRADEVSLTDAGNNFRQKPSKTVLASLIHSKYRLFGEMLDVLTEQPLTIAEIDSVICEKFGLEWTNLSNTRKRMDWLEVLELVRPTANYKIEITPAGQQMLNDWYLIQPDAIEAFSTDNSDGIAIQEPPVEIASLLQRLNEDPELQQNRNTYNIWVPSPHRIDNLRSIVQFASEQISRAALFEFIEKEFSLKTSSVDSMMPFLKASGLIEEIGRNIYISTPAAKAWLETGNDFDFIRIIHANMRFVGEMIRAAEKDIIRNDLYEQAKRYGLNTEKARWIAGFLIEAGLIEEPQYLHLKATATGIALAKELPMAEDIIYTTRADLSESKKTEPSVEKKDSKLDTAIRLLLEASVDPMAENKASGVAFEEEIAAIFRLMGFDAKRIGGSGDTDVVVGWRDDEGKKYTAIVDGKSKSSGTVSHSDISDVAIETHKDKNSADYVAIIGHAFSGDTIRNHARKKGFALITAEELGNIAKAAQTLGLSTQDLALLFRVPSGLSQLSEIISAKQREIDVISSVVLKIYSEQEELGGLSPRDMFLLMRATALSPSLEELLSVFALLSAPEIGIFRAATGRSSPENTIYTIVDAKQRASRLRAIAGAIEHGIN